MKLISAREAVNFLAQAAPRPWVQRLLRWMAFDGELNAFSSKGRVRAHTTVFSLTRHLVREVGELSGPKMDAAIRKEFAPEFAEKLLGIGRHDSVYDEPFTWDESEEPRLLDVGFFLFPSEIDWQTGLMKIDEISIKGDFFQAIFISDDMFGTEFDDPEFDAEIEGLSFDFSQIELLLPHLELGQSSGFFADLSERKRGMGRPPKWDWEGAIAYVVSQAQTPDGLPTGPGAQARIEELISGWFIRETNDAPATSQVRQRAATIMRMLEKPESPIRG